MNDMNLGAVLTAAVSAFLLGGAWYSPLLFGRIWAREANQPAQPGHPAGVFGLGFVFALISAVAFAAWLGPQPTLSRGVSLGLSAGAGMVAASFGLNYQFAQRSIKLLLIDGGYHAAQFTLYGVILGIWH